ncbi:protein takeout-like [Coccinella septempunctata]|uniref:protein takeout-like n=1 Tax=Coccinella septempunctata TaxID=41139 RepID=UPI001D07E738|nr:protein takeout-like [Coccinella septempunctata]
MAKIEKFFLFSVVLLFIYEYGDCYNVQTVAFPKEKPSWLKVCRRSDPHLNQCMSEVFQNMFPYLADGIPELNIERFEPLRLDKVSISKGHGPIILTGSLFDMEIRGPSNSTPTYTELDLQNKTWNFGINMPLLDIKSRYNLKGHILVLPLVGNGNCDLKLYDVKSRIFTNISMPMRNGREIINVDQMKVEFSVSNMKTRLYNLFNGNKVLGETVNNFINKNALEIIQELEESLNESMSEIFIHLLNNIFNKLPTDFWLLTDQQYAEYEQKLKTGNNTS